MSETERLRIAIMAARQIKAAIDEVNESRGCVAEYPDSITVDLQTFLFRSIIGLD